MSNCKYEAETVRPRKRLRTDAGQVRDKFNLSNDHFYEVSKEGGRHRVRQTFGQLIVEHAYSAQKLQLPFVSLPLKPVLTNFELSCYCSTRLVCQNKKLAHSTVPPCNSPRT